MNKEVNGTIIASSAKASREAVVLRQYIQGKRILLIGYVNGGIYAYLRVPPALASGALETDHPGAFVNRNIKGYFDFKKIDLSSIVLGDE